MKDLSDRVSGLSPAQRALLDLRLKRKKAEALKQTIPKREQSNYCPLSLDQERLWFIQQLTPESPAYNIYSVHRFKGIVDVSVLTKSLNEIVRRHEIMRTCFEMPDGRPVQVIAPHLTVDIPIIDLRSFPAIEREAVVEKLVDAQLSQPFDLTRLPLFRTVLFQLDDKDYVCPTVFHHIITDWVSFQSFQRELAVLYEAFKAGKPSPLPELAIQYADFAIWQRQWLDDQNLDAQTEYWRRQLKDAPLVLELPTDHPRPKSLRPWGVRQPMALSKSHSDAVRAMAQQEEVTLFMFFLALFKVLLFRMTGQEKILIGSPIANRTKIETQELLGFFLNHLVFCTDLSGDLTFREVLHRVRETALGAYANQDVPFRKLVEELQPQRDLSRMPLTQYVLLFLNPHQQSDVSFPGFSVLPYWADSKSTEFDMTFSLWDRETGFDGWMEYNTDLFNATTIIRLTQHCRTLLAGIITNPDQRILDLPMLTEAERHQLTVEWATCLPTNAIETSLHELFEAQVERTPNAAAVVFEGEQLTYRELDRRANQLARHLRGLGIGPDMLVGVCMERSLEMVVALLGILKAGGAYLPLDPAYPKERLAFMLEDARVSVLLTQERTFKSFPECAAQVLAVDADWQLLASHSEHNLVDNRMSDCLAYVIYTSGSTGTPKGVMISHRAVCARLLWGQATFPVSEADAVLQITSISFDVSVSEVFSPLIAGARLVLARPDAHQDIAYLMKLIADQNISIVNFTPSMLEALLEAEGIEKCKSIKEVFLGGEVLPVELQERFLSRSGARLHNLYGPTEATIDATWWTCRRGNYQSVPIGRPVANTKIHLLDQKLQPVPIGVVGEICIGGTGLAEGYLNRPDLTAEKFMPDPFSQELGARLYQSGDRARFTPDGNIMFLGRVDLQAKVRGFRIETGEIEAVLARHPNVREVVVVVREQPAGNKRLVAYVVIRQPQEAAISTLRGYLKEKLPEYMIPSAFVMLEQLPLTPSGKVDRQALPSTEGGKPWLEEKFVAPRTPVEQALAEIWSHILGVKQVGIHDNFFELGGDSILSIQIITRANKLGLHLIPKQVFEHQTIAELACVVGTVEVIQSEQNIVTGPMPLTPIQHWFFEQDLPDPHHFNQALLLELRQELDSGLLERVVDHLLVHHDGLRMRFVRGESGWQQINAEREMKTPFAFVDLSSLPDEQQGTTIESSAAEMQVSLNLSDGPLMRVARFKLGQMKPDRLLIIIHHLVIDGVAWRILLEDLQAGYQQLSRTGVIEFPPKTTSFKRWCERQAQHAQSDEIKREEDYWTAMTLPQIASLPVDYIGEANTVASARTVRVTLSTERTRTLLQDIPPAYRTRINDVLLTALLQAYVEWSRELCLLIDLEGHGREQIFDDADTSRTIGWFTSMYPVLLEMKGGLHAGDGLKSIKEKLRSIPGHGIGYGLLRYVRSEEAIREKLRSQPQAEVSFNYLGQLDQALVEDSLFSPAQELCGPTCSLRASRRYLLDIVGRVAGGQLQMDWTYSENLYKRSTIESLAHGFMSALETIIAHCQSDEAGGYTPSDFPLAHLDQQKIDQLLGADRQIEDVYPLSAVQQGMLFHALYAHESETYVEQLSCELQGDLDTVAFEQAWQRLADRHAILRTSFIWSELNSPLQVVRQRVKMSLDQQDWRSISTIEQQERLAAHLALDRKQSFELNKAPLMRLALMRVKENVYKFVWSHHHLLLDGWSTPLLIKEAMAFYEALISGEQLWMEREQPFKNYIKWLQEQDLSKAEAYWRQMLEGVTKPTSLGIDRLSGDSVDRDGYGDEMLRLSKATAEALQLLSRKHHLTLNTLVQGAWALLLSRYSGDEDVIFGVTVSGRSADIKGIESMIGLFVNTLPARVCITSQTPILSWLKQLQAMQAEMRQYEYSPLVQEWSGVPLGWPLFESLLVFENYPMDDLAWEQGASIEARDFTALVRTKYPITLVVVPAAEPLLYIAYNRRRFDRADISRMLEHLKAILEGFVSDPEGRLSDLHLLTAAERHQWLVERDQPRLDYSQAISIHSLFEAQVERSPYAVAAISEGEELSYTELNKRANQLAHYLQRLGVLNDMLVGIILDHSLETIIGLLGILKAGGVYLPLDPAYPKPYIDSTIQDAQLSVLLGKKWQVEELPQHEIKVVYLDSDWEGIAHELEVNPVNRVMADSPACVTYTSVYADRPKGVMNTHRGICNQLLWIQDMCPLTEADRVLQKVPDSFGASVLELLWPLISGACLVVARTASHQDFSYLADLINRHAISTLQLATPMLRGIFDDERLHAFKSLRHVICSGEARPLKWPVQHFAGTEVKQYNLYIPTEVPAFVAHLVSKSDPEEPTMPVGRPIANTRLYILDKHMRPVPTGLVGELYVADSGSAQCYMNLPALAAESFVPASFSNERGEILYRTGDRARFLPDGDIEFMGQANLQVTVRGSRVELSRIEVMLLWHPAVREAVVLAYANQINDMRLVAYIVPRQGHIPVTNDLRSFLKVRLPEHLVPSGFVVLESLPLTISGNIDRQALSASNPTMRAWEDGFVAPRGPVEEVLSSIWSEVLGLERVGRNDNFFELGGHSLLATQVISRLRRAFNIEMSLKHLFEASTVADLARRIEGEMRAERNFECPPIRPVSRHEKLPLSFAQEPLWALDQVIPGTYFFNVSTAIRLSGWLDVVALEKSFEEIMRRHEVLRTTFDVVDGVAVQVIAPSACFVLPVIDLCLFEEVEREAEAFRLAAEDALQPFDLSRGPLLRISLLRLSDQDHRILFTMHHIIGDGWSVGVFVRELAALYEAFSNGRSSPLSDLPIQYADYAYWQRQWLDDQVMKPQFEYWKEQLGGNFPILNIPTDNPKTGAFSLRTATQSLALGETLSAALKSSSRSEGVSLFMLLLAALQVLLYRYTNQEHIRVGTLVANRNRSEVEALIGLFINTLVLTADISGDNTRREVLQQVRERVLAAFNNQDIPFEQMVQALENEYNLDRNSLFQVLFILQNTPMEPLMLPGLTVSLMSEEGALVEPDAALTTFDLILMMEEGPQGLIGLLRYKKDLFHDDTINRMLMNFQIVLESIVSEPDERISTVPLVSLA